MIFLEFKRDELIEGLVFVWHVENHVSWLWEPQEPAP